MTRQRPPSVSIVVSSRPTTWEGKPVSNSTGLLPPPYLDWYPELASIEGRCDTPQTFSSATEDNKEPPDPEEFVSSVLGGENQIHILDISG